jgi:hypothetical protein
MNKDIENAMNYIGDVMADMHDNPPPNEESALLYASTEMHLGAVRFILLGETGKALGLLSNFDITYRMKRMDFDIPRVPKECE